MSRPMTLTSGSPSDLLSRPVRETTTAELARLFAAGEKPRDHWMIGLELELLPFRRSDLGPVEHPSIARVLDRLIATRGLSPEHEASGALIGAKGAGVVVSLEPGGQIEYASRPYRKLKELRSEVCDFAAAMREAGELEGVGFWAMGHQPFVDRDTAAKMPKARYDLMRRFMPTRGTRGLDMMHLTGSVQCAVDYESERNMTDKVRTAARVSPLLAALTASSPFVGGRLSGRVCERYEIWRHTDAARSGLWPEMLDGDGLTYERYVLRALSVPAMFFLRDGEYRLPESRPFSYFAEHGFDDQPVTVADFVDHLTSLFPEIRLKSYIELRGTDCAPPQEAVAIAAFWRGLLDLEDTRREVEERLVGLGYPELVALQAEVARAGLGATTPLGPVRELIRGVVELAYAGLARAAPDCADCMVPLLERARRGVSLAEEMIERARGESVQAAVSLAELSDRRSGR